MTPTWQQRYADKLKTARAALSTLQRGYRVWLGSGASEPQLLTQALEALAERWGSGDLVRLFSLGGHLRPLAEAQRRFAHTVFSLGPQEREPFAQGLIHYWPAPLAALARMLHNGLLPLDVALVQVSPPDEQGNCSLGLSVELNRLAAEQARYVIAEVNPLLPRTAGESGLSIERFDALVEANTPPLEYRYPAPDETAQRIAGHAARLVADGATLHVGRGTLAQAVLPALANKRDLGLHTDLLTDGWLDLLEAGVVTNAAKQLHPGLGIVSGCLGTARLYRAVQAHPALAFYPAEYVHDLDILRQEPLTAVQSAVAVELTGQACLAVAARSSVAEWELGAGEGPDMASGAALAPGGRSLLLLPALTPSGASRIVPQLPEGATQLLAWDEVDAVVTEYGVAELRGRDLAERAAGLIAVAHPDHRAALLRQAQELGALPADQPLALGVYPSELETEATFRDGLTVRFRPIKPSDEQLCEELFYALSERTVYFRFFNVPRVAPRSLFLRLTHGDYERELAIVGLVKQGDREQIIAVGEYAVNAETQMADVALTVRDDYQRHGIGTWLLFYLGHHAQRQGLAGLKADLLATNQRAMSLVRRAGYPVETAFREGYLRVSYRFPKVENPATATT